MATKGYRGFTVNAALLVISLLSLGTYMQINSSVLVTGLKGSVEFSCKNGEVPEVVEGGKGSSVSDKLIDGSSMKTSDALDAGSEFLGKGYTEPKPGSGRFVSADGTHVFRMGENDILGKHGGGRHVNFKILEPNPAKPGKMQVIKDIHIYLED